MEALTIASTAISAVGSIVQGQQQAANYNAQAQANAYNAQVQRNNAIIAENNARAASDQANAKEEAQRRHFRSLQGQAIAGVAQSGTGFDGSNEDLLKQNAVANELDALTIRYEGQNQSNAFTAEANNRRAQADLEQFSSGVNRMNASNAITASYFNAGANLLSGASRYKYYDLTGKMPGIA